ncbi:MAG TPA: PQQ-binding-like beta-propeller repeat protein [Gaiellaceae bacterium]|jgi:sugar lactone lactonase YvrE
MNRRELLLAAAAVAVAPRRTLAAVGAAPLVLVTADLESSVLAVHPASGKLRRRVRTAAFPRSIETVGGTAVVAHSEIGAVSVIDAATLSVAYVLRGFGEPRYTAAHPDGRHAFVTDAAKGEVVAIDVLRGRVVGREQVGSHARHVTVDPAGRTLWIALGSKAAEVAIVDISTPDRPRLARRFHPPFLAHDVGLAPDGRHLWVSSGDRQELAVYDRRDGRLLARPSGDWPPQHVTFAGETVYVTSGWSGTLRLHRVDGRPVRQMPVAVGSYNVQQSLGLVVTPALGRGTLTVLDDRGRVLLRKRVARSSHDACLIRT